MNNEPVAWMSEFGQFIGKVQDEICHIPLYTNPANPYQSITDTKIEPTVVSYTHPAELTDEEIISTMVQFDVYSSDDHCLIEAGRAILRKAQER